MTLTTHLGQLEGAGLINLAALRPEVEYRFRHGLVQEAAYFSLVKGDRRALHRAVGETLEQLYLGQPARPARELLPELAHHFAEASEAARALEYFTLAGDAAASQYANAEAIAHYSRALDLALPTRATPAQLAHLFDRRGRAQELSGQYDAALVNYRQWETIAQQRGDRAMALAALTRRVVAYAVPSANSDPVQAHALAATALPEARALGDREVEARLHWAVMLAHSHQGDGLAASISGRRALELARAIGHTELVALSLMDLSRMYLTIGRLDDSASTLAESIELWDALGNLPMLAEARTNAAGMHLYLGDYDRATALLADSLTISEAIGNAWGQSYNLMLRFFILLDMGSFGAAIRAMRRCLVLAEEGGFIYPAVGGNAMLGWIYGLLGQPELAEASFARSMQAVEQFIPTERATVLLPWAWWKLSAGEVAQAEALIAAGREALNPHDRLSANLVMLAYLEAELALHKGRTDQALHAARRFDSDPSAAVMATFRVDLLRVEGAALMALGQLADAHAKLEQARALAAALPSPRALWAIARTCASLAQHQADAAAVQHWQAEARRHLAYLLDNLDDPELRASFLRQPDVRATLEAA